MGSRKVSVEKLSATVMQGLNEYVDGCTEKLKTSVEKAGKTVKKEISATAPSRSGKYAKSWRAKKTKESSTTLEVTVYSPSRYMLAHLLEHGHAKRGGGRVEGRPHIAPAEEKGIRELEQRVERDLKA